MGRLGKRVGARRTLVGDGTDAPKSPRRAGLYVTVGKRAFDLVLGLLLFVLAVPVVAGLAVLSAASLRSWPFFVQDRVGRNGRILRFPKIRTLPKTAAAAADKHEIAQIRIPRWSAFLRKTHLDELPQLVCVLLGQMSLVGPRPEMPEILERYPRDFAQARGKVRPGCTGLWQISVAASGMIYEAPEHDLFYVEHSSLALDSWILWRTVLSSASRRFRTDLADIPKWAARPTPGSGSEAQVVARDVDDSSLRQTQPVDIDLVSLERPALVTGAGGFIGGRLVQRLIDAGVPVRAVDARPTREWRSLDSRADNRVADLHELPACRDAVAGIGLVYNLSAASAMGCIENNNAQHSLSVLVNTHLLIAARDAGAQRFLFASPACAHGSDRSSSPERFGEQMCRHFREDFGLETRIARYENVFGPYGRFTGGGELAPAAICRKVAEAKFFGHDEIAILGDGEQTGSFMFIDDCIAGIELVMASDCAEPVDLGSGQTVTVNELVDIVCGIAGVKLRRRFALDAAPVAHPPARKDLSSTEREIGWTPATRLEDGLERTYRWIYEHIAEPQHVGT